MLVTYAALVSNIIACAIPASAQDDALLLNHFSHIAIHVKDAKWIGEETIYRHGDLSVPAVGAFNLK